jgi:ABC-type transport system involved in multi-copper enzyme maturation permease subunit
MDSAALPAPPSRLVRWLPTLGLLAWAGSLLFVLVRYRATMADYQIGLVILAWFAALVLVARNAVKDMFGPVFFYDIVRSGRSRLTFSLRFFYVAGISMLLAGMYASWITQDDEFARRGTVDTVSTAKLSRFAYAFFQAFAVIQYIVVVLLTPVYVAGSIAVEKERKTLEFLFATDLRNREIIFGKVASRVVNLLSYTLAGLPVVALLQLFGGIDPKELLAAFTATVLTIIGLSAVSIWFSTMMKKPRDAMLLTYLAVVAYIFLSFLLAILPMIPPPTGVTFWWQSPITVLGRTFTAGDVTFAAGYGNPLLGVMRIEMSKSRGGGGPPISGTVDEVIYDFALFWTIVSALLLAWSIARVRSIALAQAYGPVRQPRSARARAARQHPEIGENPVFWKEVFVDSGGSRGRIWLVVNILLVTLIFIWIPFILYFSFISPPNYRNFAGFPELYDHFTEGMNAWVRVATSAFTTLMFFAAAIRGAGAISGEKDKDTWISLISTPMSSDQMLWGKWWGCLLGLRRGFFLLILIYSLALITGSVHPLGVLIALVLTVICMSAFSWIGLYCSMRAKNSLNASIQAFFATVFFAGGFWVLIGCGCGFPLSLMRTNSRWVEDAAQVILGFTPPVALFGAAPRHFGWDGVDKYENRPFDFDASNGFGYYSIILGIIFWFVFNGLLMALSMAKFRGLTNRNQKK